MLNTILGSSLIRKLQDKPNTSPSTTRSRLNIELDKYLVQEFTDSSCDSDSGPLVFFSKHSVMYPKLSKVARELFSIPATSVPAECLFSHVGLTQSELRNRLNPNLLESLTLIKDNIKYF